MAPTKLDAVVKGAASEEKEKAAAAVPNSGVTLPTSASDPLASLPSSPPQIYLNLLILECSLRTQYLELRARRRQHTFFLSILFLWTSYFTYALFLAPREDGSIGGSVYWAVEMGEKVAFMGGVITAVLVWGTGQWERGVRWPRRWVGVTNRGLRGFNLKIVVVKRSMLREWLDTLKFFVDGGLWRGVDNTNYRFIPPAVLHEGKEGRRNSALPNISESAVQDSHTSHKGRQEDLSPGGDSISLLLLPKPFSPAFRENWDLYRSEYWEKENTRRAALLTKLKAHDKAVLKKAKQEAGWSAWYSWIKRSKTKHDVEKHGHHHLHGPVGHLRSQEKRLRSGSNSSRRDGSHSRNSSRSSTPLLEPADLPDHRRVRRSSTTSNTSSANEKRKKRPTAHLTATGSSSSSTARVQKLTPATLEGKGSSRTPTPASDGEEDKKPPGSPLARQGSFASVSSFEIEKEESVGPDGEELRTKKKGRRESAVAVAER